MSPTFTKGARVLLYGAMPAAAMLAGSPVGLSVLETAPPSLDLVLLAAPFYLGLLSGPGYIYLAYTSASAHAVGGARRWWLRASLFAALVASVGGAWGGTVIFFLLPPSLVSGVAVILLWRAFERVPRVRDPAASR